MEKEQGVKKMRKGMGLIEALVASVVLSVIGAMTAALLLVSQKAITRERERQKGLFIVFGKAQEMLTTSFSLLPPQTVPEDMGTVTVALSFPANPESVQVTDEQGKSLPFKFSEKELTVSLPLKKPKAIVVTYLAKVAEEDGWKVWMKGEFVTKDLKPSFQPTPLKRLTLWGEKGQWKTHKLWLLKGR